MTEADSTRQTPQTAEQIKADIDDARAQLSEAVDALSAKVDVKAQAKARVEQTREAVAGATDRVREATPDPVRRAVGNAAQRVAPAADSGLAKVRPYRKQLLAGLGAALIAVVLFRRRSS